MPSCRQYRIPPKSKGQCGMLRHTFAFTVGTSDSAAVVSGEQAPSTLDGQYCPRLLALASRTAMPGCLGRDAKAM